MTPYALTEEELVLLASMELNEKLVIEFPSAPQPNRLEIIKAKRQPESRCTVCCCFSENDSCKILFKSGKLKIKQELTLLPYDDYTRPCLDISNSPVTYSEVKYCSIEVWFIELRNRSTVIMFS